MSWCASCGNSAVPNVGDVCRQCSDAEAESREDARASYVPNHADTEDVEKIQCDCLDGSCSGKTGEEGEVGGHIEGCDCSHCHHELGKI